MTLTTLTRGWCDNTHTGKLCPEGGAQQTWKQGRTQFQAPPTTRTKDPAGGEVKPTSTVKQTDPSPRGKAPNDPQQDGGHTHPPQNSRGFKARKSTSRKTANPHSKCALNLNRRAETAPQLHKRNKAKKPGATSQAPQTPHPTTHKQGRPLQQVRNTPPASGTSPSSR